MCSEIQIPISSAPMKHINHDMELYVNHLPLSKNWRLSKQLDAFHNETWKNTSQGDTIYPQLSSTMGLNTGPKISTRMSRQLPRSTH